MTTEFKRLDEPGSMTFVTSTDGMDDMGDWAAENAESIRPCLDEKHDGRERERVIEESINHYYQPAGCTGDCCYGDGCSCFHVHEWKAPRQPRKPTNTVVSLSDRITTVKARVEELLRRAPKR